MRAATSALLVLVGALVTLPLAAQEPAPIRRVQPRGFPVAFTASAGMGFGGTRAEATSATECPDDPCQTLGAGSGWNVGAEFQMPIGRTFGFEVAGQLARPSQRLCLGPCQSPTNLWAIRGTAMILWRFKARAPVFFGLGGGVTYFDPAPVVNQNLTSEGQGSSTEYGGATIVGYDFRFSERIGGRLAWRSYLLVPSSEGLPGGHTAKSLAWDNAFTFGVRFLLGS